MDAIGVYIMRRFAYYGAYRLGITSKLERFERMIIRSIKGGRCLSSDVLGHYVDDVFIRLYNNMYSSLKIRSGKELLEYKDVDDPINSDNYILFPTFFGFSVPLCPDTGGSCASSPSKPCGSVYIAQSRQPLCCTSAYGTFGNLFGIFSDTPPYITNYSTGVNGLNYQYPTSPGIVVLNFGFGGPSCLPTSGVSLQGPTIATNATSTSSGTCASSCPSGSFCGQEYNNYCPGSTYPTAWVIPLLYFTASLTVLPNTAYSAWVEFQFS